MKILYSLLTFLILCANSYAQKGNKLILNNGNIEFMSEASLELIQAKSNNLKGILIPSERIFAFSIDNNSFDGFNGSLQKEHFNENYLESDKYPRCTYSGKIVEVIDFTKDGKSEIRAKGKLTIHGIERERIIKVNIEVKNGKIYVSSKFQVLLEDYGIRIPTIVNQKIAEEIQVSVQAVFDKYE